MNNKMNKTRRINFLVTEEEKNIIEKNANFNEMSVSNYLRLLGLHSYKINVLTKVIHEPKDN